MQVTWSVFPKFHKHLGPRGPVAVADKPDKRWKREWAPVYEGVMRWDEVFAALAAIDFHGVIKLMRHYETKDRDRQQEKLKKEVAYLKKLFDQANKRI